MSACKHFEGALDCFEQLLIALLRKDADKQIANASRQIVNCLVDNVLTLEGKIGMLLTDFFCSFFM